MRVSGAEKERSRERILAEAARLFREKGLDQTGVADIMQAAGLTHGGFYRHFDSKDALALAAMTHAFDTFLGWSNDETVAEAPAAARDFRDRYLSIDHVTNPGLGCPITALGSDFARAPEPLRAGFAEGVRRAIRALSQTKTGNPGERASAATRELATLFGAVTLARILGGKEAEFVLKAVKAADDDMTPKPPGAIELE